jgi:hypothetical protein
VWVVTIARTECVDSSVPALAYPDEATEVVLSQLLEMLDPRATVEPSSFAPKAKR